jgi:hypothetical protein
MPKDYAQRRRLIAHELRDLADQIEVRLPEKGAITELARALDKQLDEMRPYRDPRARQKQAKRLGELLSKRTRSEVRLRYEPTKHWRTNKPGYYKVRWSNGPSYDTMRTLVDQIMTDARTGGRLDLIDSETLALERDGGGWCELAALFEHLESGTDGKADINEHVGPEQSRYGTDGGYHRLDDFTRRLWDDTDYPERLNARWRPQLEALNELVVEHWRRHQRHRSMHELFAEQLREHGWPRTRAWLDKLAGGLNNPGVTRPDQCRLRPAPSITPDM